MKKTAIVLFNLGGPDSLEAVQPFLFNLFSDKAIINLPQPLRWLVATLISSRRTPTAKHIYAQMGGRSPILPETQAQAAALEARLPDTKVFIAMRYWHPFTAETVAQVKAYAPDNIVLLPLYPQFSTATTASSFEEWDKQAKHAGLTILTKRIGCYPLHPSFIAAYASLIQPQLTPGCRVLFSAHGLPEKVIQGGDPYQWQIEQTAKAVAEKLALSGLDWQVSYQSRVGPLKWIGPSTEEEIKRAGKEGKALVVVPIAFVSEHSETLVELDIEYRQLADASGVSDYRRVAALGVQPLFIDALAELCISPGESREAIMLDCEKQYSRCYCALNSTI